MPIPAGPAKGGKLVPSCIASALRLASALPSRVRKKRNSRYDTTPSKLASISASTPSTFWSSSGDSAWTACVGGQHQHET